MAFRDDRDALTERVRVLEMELERAVRARDEAERAAARARSLGEQLARAERELADRRRGEGPSLRRRTILFAVALVGTAGTGAATLWWTDGNVQRERVALLRHVGETETRERQVEARARLLEDQLSRTEQRVAELEEERAARRAPPPEPPRSLPPEPWAPERPSARTLARRALVERVTGPAPVTRGQACTVDLDVEAGECRAHVRCDGVGLYPDPGNGGYFPCEADAEGPIQGADVRRTEISGDPRFGYDRSRDRATVSDGLDAEAWSVELRLR